MKKRSLAICLLAMGIGAVTAPSALAMPPGPPPDSPMMPPELDRPPPYLRGVHLSDAQKDQIFDILHRAAPALRAKGSEVRRAQVQLHELAMSASYDETKAKTLADAGARAMAELALLRAGTDNQIFRLLTAEQRKQLAAPPEGDRCAEPPRR